MFTALLAAASLTASQPASVQVSLAEAACLFTRARVETFVDGVDLATERLAVSAFWLTAPMDRGGLAALLAQEDRERGPDAPFAMGYRPDFARAIETLSDAQLDRFHAGLASTALISCAGLDVYSEPFTEDIAGFERWAEDQMLNPEPNAPAAAQSLALSRPVHFDGGARVLVAEAFSYTPIPLSRPPSSALVFAVYQRDGAQWRHEASIIIARAG